MKALRDTRDSRVTPLRDTLMGVTGSHAEHITAGQRVTPGVTGVTPAPLPPPPPPKGAGERARARTRGAPLQRWIATLKARGIIVTATPEGLHLHGPVIPADRRMAERYRHALLVAAAGTHPTWWTHISGRSPEQPDYLEIPSTAASAFACVTCGGDADVLDGDLLAWCEAHR